jgi:membrane protein YdbS with pleckstrin-like domain
MLFRNVFKESAHYKTIEAFDPDERVLCSVKQHPFGILIIYVTTVLAFTIGLAIISYFLSTLFGTNQSVYTLWAFIAIILSLIIFAILLLASYVYNQTSLTVTDRNVVQIMQSSIYERKVSHISLANVEDVTSEQLGLFANFFNFGTVKIETAGEQANFIFALCPHPNRISRIILDAKDDFIRTTGQTGSFRNNVKLRQTALREQDQDYTNQ